MFISRREVSQLAKQPAAWTSPAQGTLNRLQDVPSPQTTSTQVVVPMKDAHVQTRDSLPEFMDFKLFGKTFLALNTNFRRFVANPLRK